MRESVIENVYVEGVRKNSKVVLAARMVGGGVREEEMDGERCTEVENQPLAIEQAPRPSADRTRLLGSLSVEIASTFSFNGIVSGS